MQVLAWSGFAAFMVAVVGLGFVVPVLLYRRRWYLTAFVISLPTALATTLSFYFAWASPVTWWMTVAAIPAALRAGVHGRRPRPANWSRLSLPRRSTLAVSSWFPTRRSAGGWSTPVVCWAAWKFEHVGIRYAVAFTTTTAGAVVAAVVHPAYLCLAVFGTLLVLWALLDHLAAIRILTGVPEDALDLC